MPANSAQTVRTSSRVKSRISNGRLFFAGTDGRSATARRFRDLFAAYCQDLGGVEAMSEAAKSLARRAASLSVELERRECDQVGAGGFDGLKYAVMAGTLARILGRLGIEKSPPPGAPSTERLSDEDLAGMTNAELVAAYHRIPDEASGPGEQQ